MEFSQTSWQNCSPLVLLVLAFVVGSYRYSSKFIRKPKKPDKIATSKFPKQYPIKKNIWSYCGKLQFSFFGPEEEVFLFLFFTSSGRNRIWSVSIWFCQQILLSFIVYLVIHWLWFAALSDRIELFPWLGFLRIW